MKALDIKVFLCYDAQSYSRFKWGFSMHAGISFAMEINKKFAIIHNQDRTQPHVHPFYLITYLLLAQLCCVLCIRG